MSLVQVVNAATTARLSSRGVNTVHVKPVAPVRLIDTSARAMTSWTLDGKGCSGSRSDTMRLHTSKAQNCPLKPIDLSTLCGSHHGRFEMNSAVFEQLGDDLYLYSSRDPKETSLSLTVDGRPVFAQARSKMKLRAGQVVRIGSEEFQLFRNSVAHA